MGWLVWNIGRLSSRKEVDEIFRKQIVGENCEILKSCCRGYTWWCAAIKDKKTGQVMAGISKYYYNPKDGSFGYKWMDETYGPYFLNYPKSYFKLLTPTDSEFANQWRARQQAEYDRRAKK